MHNIITTAEERAVPYLDRFNGSSGGGVSNQQRTGLDIQALQRLYYEIGENGKVYDEINKVNICHKMYAKLAVISTESKIAYLQLKCHKWWRPSCGGINGTIHIERYQSVMNRLQVENYFARQLVFTVPDYLRPLFKSKIMINNLFALVHGVIEREFGQPQRIKRDKKGRVKETIYGIKKPVVAFLHVDGKEKDTFNPHINVQIFEKHGEKHKISLERLSRIQESYRKALSLLLRATVPMPIIHYSYKVEERKIRQAIRYMAKPTDPEMIDHIDFDLKKLLCLDLKGLHFIRFWGTSANSEYKKHDKDSKKNTPRVFEIDGIGYRLVGVITQAEFDTETANKRLSRTVTGLITVIDDPPDDETWPIVC